MVFVGEWKECQLGDLIIFQRGHDLPKTKMQGGEYPVVGSNGIIGYHNEYTTEAPSITIGRSGNVGKPFLFKGRSWSHNTSLYIKEYKAVDPIFIYYFLQTLDLGNYAGGSAVPTLNRNHIHTLNVYVPTDIAEQRKIGAVLSAIDDKIELNNAINDNLEQQAHALFKAWFVDFEPFGGIMPENWRMGTFSEIIESTLGGDWGKEEPTGNYTEQVYCIRGADIPEVKAGNKGKMPTRYILPKNYKSKKLVPDDIVIEISGGSPIQSTGRSTVIPQSLLNRYDMGMVCTNFCRAIKPIQGYSKFIYYYWQYLYDRKVFFSYENGTTGIKNLDISGFIETEPVIIPSVEALDKFNELSSVYFQQIFANGLENEKLSSLRDTLLPKLMNGEIDVSEVKI